MITFDEAKSAVLKLAKRDWNSGRGTLVIAPTGFESPTYWRPRAVAQQELDGDMSFTQMDETIYLVNKNTGKVTVTTYLVDPEKIDDMVPYPAQ
jgi:hypothetical protein